MHRSKRLLSSPLLALAVLFVSVFSFGGVAHAQTLQVRPLSANEQIIQEQSKQVQQKSTVLQTTSQEAEQLQAKKQALADQLAAEQAKIAELKQQIADKKAADEAAKAAAAVQPAPVQTYVAAAPVPQGGVHYNCGDNYYAAYIYGNESGGHVVGNCDTGARNGSGCLGIGQACPGSKLLAVCPNLDYDCENAFFTDYANKYGGWAGAYQFWLNNHWW